MLLSKLKIAPKLYLLVLVLCLFIIAIGLYGIRKLEIIHDNTETLYQDRVIPITQLTNVRYAYTVGILSSASQARNREINFADAIRCIAQAEKTISRNWSKYKLTYLTPEEAVQVGELESRMPAAMAEVERLKDVLALEDAKALESFLGSDFDKNIKDVMSRINKLVNLQVAVSEEIYRHSGEVYAFTSTRFYLLIAFCLVFAVSFSLLILKNVRSMIGELRTSEKKYRGIFENVQDVFYQSTLDGKILEISPSVLQVSGFSREQLVGTSSSNLYYDIADRQKSLEILQKEGAIKDYEIRFKSKAGELIYGLLNVKLVRNPDGSPAHLDGMFKNITNRKKNEERLRRSTELLNEAQAVARMGSWEIDMVNDTHSWSDEVFKMYGVGKDEIEPSTEALLSFMHPEDRQRSEERARETYGTLRDASYDFRFIRKDGSVRFGHCEWRFEFDKAGNPTRLYGILQDVTERKAAEYEKEKMVADIMQRNKYFEQFSYIVSHNLRGTVVNILGIADAIKTSESAEQRNELEDYLFQSVGKLDEIIKVLNEIVQIRNVNTQDKETIHLEELVNGIKPLVPGLDDNVEIKTAFAANSLVAYKSAITSILLNLISNSVKYRQPDRKTVIEIASFQQQDKISISFKDNASGIDLDKYGDRIFGLAQRFHLNVDGKGLGLFLVKAQVELLGGSIWIKSEPGVGTEFAIELPQR